MFLSVRSGAGGASASTITLPLAWAADTVPETVALITELHQMVSNGYDLRDALARVQAPAAAATNKPSNPAVGLHWSRNSRLICKSPMESNQRLGKIITAHF